MRVSILLTVLLLTGNIAHAAPTVTFFLDASFGQFTLTARSSAGDNAGIAAYNIPIIVAPGITIETLNHQSARAGIAENLVEPLKEGSIGFTLMRSPDGPANLVIRGAQDTVSPTPFIIYGYGQTPGSFATVTNGPAIPFGVTEGNPWPTNPIIASGTYSGPGVFPAMSIDTNSNQLFASVFTNNQGLAVTSLSKVVPSELPGEVSITVVPEPTPVVMAFASVFGLFTVARHQRLICDKFVLHR